MSRIATETRSPNPRPAPQPPPEHDAWLEDVRRWYYGGMEPPDASEAPASQPSADVHRTQQTAG